jgi:predicted ATPase
VDQLGLLERAAELGTLHGCAAEVAAHGHGRVVLAFGEAGIGKTALLRQFCDELSRRITKFWGMCDPLFTPRPLGPLLEPAVLVLEDLHWGDEATLDVVRVLARRAGEVGLLLVLSYRSDLLHRDHPLRMVLGELPPGEAVIRLELAALSRETVDELAAREGLESGELYQRTGGNPFFVTETLAAGSTLVPETVRDAVYARIGRLSANARALLEAVAIVPQRTEVWLLEALTEGRLDALDECLRSGCCGPRGTASYFATSWHGSRSRSRCRLTGRWRCIVVGWQRWPIRRLPRWILLGLPTTPRRRATALPCSATRRRRATGRPRSGRRARRSTTTGGRCVSRLT